MGTKKKKQTKKDKSNSNISKNSKLDVSFENKTRKQSKGLETKAVKPGKDQSLASQRSQQRHTQKMANIERRIKNSSETQRTARTSARSAAAAAAATKYAENMNGGFIIGPAPTPSDNGGDSSDNSGQNELQGSGSSGSGRNQKEGS